MGVDTGADRGAAQRQFSYPTQAGVHPVDALAHLGRPAAHLLAHAHRHGVHEVRASGLDHIVHGGGFGDDGVVQVLEAGDERLFRLQVRGYVDRRGNDIVRRLAHVDVVVRVHLAAQGLCRQRGDDLVGVHIGAGAGAGLEDVDGEMLVVAALGDGAGAVLDGLRHVGLHQAQVEVGLGAGGLDQSQRPDEAAGESQPADGEVVDSALRLRRVQGLGRDVHLAEGVFFDAVVAHGGDSFC